jgi:hypothetical protein
MTTEYKTASWAQLKDGTWGLRLQGEATEGEVVKAQTRGGKVSYETVGKIVTSETRGIYSYTLASLGPKPEIKKPAKKRAPISKKLLQKATNEYIDYATAKDIYGKELDQESGIDRLRPKSDDDLPY